MYKTITLAGVAFGSGFDAEVRAKQMATRKFDAFFLDFGRNIRESTHRPLRELYADKCFTCYLIKVEVELTETDLLVLANRDEIIGKLEHGQT